LTVGSWQKPTNEPTPLPNGASASALVEMPSDERHTFGA